MAEDAALQRELQYLTDLISSHKRGQHTTASYSRAPRNAGNAYSYSNPKYQRNNMTWTTSKHPSSAKTTAKASQVSTYTLTNKALSKNKYHMKQSAVTRHASVPAEKVTSTFKIAATAGPEQHLKTKVAVPKRTTSNVARLIARKTATSTPPSIVVPSIMNKLVASGTSVVKAPKQIAPLSKDKDFKPKDDIKSISDVKIDSRKRTCSVPSTSSPSKSKYSWTADQSPKKYAHIGSVTTATMDSMSQQTNMKSAVTPGIIVKSQYKLKRVKSSNGVKNTVPALAKAGTSQSAISKTPVYRTKYKIVHKKSNTCNRIVTAPAIATRYKYTKKSLASNYVKKTPKSKIPHRSQLKLTRKRTPNRNVYSLIRTPGKVSKSSHRGWISRYSLQKGSTMKVLQSAVEFKQNKYKLIRTDTSPRLPQNSYGSPIPSRSKLKLDRRVSGTPNSISLVSIGGILYRCSSSRLSRATSSSTARRSSVQDGRVIVKNTRTKLIKRAPKELLQTQKVIVNVLGQRFTMDSSGRTLRRLVTPPSSDKSLSRVDIGGMTFVQTAPGTLVRRDNEHTKAIAHRALQRSIQTSNALKWKKSKPKQFCMFYNRFGKCNRCDKCPYIHDPDKVAVCTRFLRGTCKAGDKCQFSHKVSKDKMPVCSFFLRGVCIRDDCPYLHVNVNRKAAVCQDFLKGYCPLGQKCKKRHVLECPEFARTGHCSDGEKCKMRHRTRKTKETRDGQDSDKNCSDDVKITDTGSTVIKRKQVSDEYDSDDSDMSPVKKSRKLPSFIALPDDDTPKSDQTTSQQTLHNQESLHIRPRFIMQKHADENKQN